MPGRTPAKGVQEVMGVFRSKAREHHASIIAFAIAVINYLAVPHRFDEEPTAAVQDGGIYLLS